MWFLYLIYNNKKYLGMPHTVCVCNMQILCCTLEWDWIVDEQLKFALHFSAQWSRFPNNGEYPNGELLLLLPIPTRKWRQPADILYVFSFAYCMGRYGHCPQISKNSRLIVNLPQCVPVVCSYHTITFFQKMISL